MQNRLKMFGLPVASIAAMCVFGVAGAAESGRAAYNVNRMNRAGLSGTQRMPSMPTLPINTTGNMTVDLPTQPTPTVPNTPDTPDTPDEPTPECPDGGVKNSEYTVDNCMRDVFACVNNGALPNGINDMFNEELRNSIINGMGLCSAQVERCIAEVRRDCENIYHSSADVWIDFNARKVQPEYYSFVLRKTGLTPRQAENTCWLLDKNTYGKSFDAVANSGVTTYEYNNRVGAYNGQGGANIIKKNPQGATLNNGNDGVDGGRGHYARWDATTAECHIRVAAYNKDTPIKNSWLFGAVGDDRLAEAWERAGSTFTCNKDLFGFSLYKNTNTVAVVGIGGGTLVGAGIGALAGHGDRDFDCGNSDHRERLMKLLKEKRNVGVMNEFLVNRDATMEASANNMTESQCREIVNLYDKYNQLQTALNRCKGTGGAISDVSLSVTVKCEVSDNNIDITEAADWATCRENLKLVDSRGVAVTDIDAVAICENTGNAEECMNELNNALLEKGKQIATNQLNKLGLTADGTDLRCFFKPINQAFVFGDDIYCLNGCTKQECGPDCWSVDRIDSDVNRLKQALSGVGDVISKGDKNNRVKTTLTGAAIGAGTGGLATAITAFVEKNNINCRLGDGLDQIGYGKSMSIGSLRDFYVKWNLRLPENVAPTAMVVDCNSWRRACAEITDLEQCKSAQINYKPAGAPAITLIHAACIPSGSVCIENYPVAKSYGACVPQDASDDSNKDNSDTTAQ
ncbi:MAG: hypothetical protein K2M34_03150 [Alphaproteobacteria bacterium]|nr:hypothetical protein [Alphaproteobacteria bacterium]